MANQNKDVLRVFDTAANIATTLRNKQFGFDTTNSRLAIKDASGTMHYFSSAATATDILIVDNTTDSFRVRESTNEYINIDTTNGSEKITFGKDLVLVEDIFIPDDKQAKWGNTNAVPDAYIEWDTASDPDCWKFYATGTDGGVTILFETANGSDTIQFKPGGTATVLIGNGSVDVTGYITASNSMYLSANDTYLYGKILAGDYKDIIGITAADKIAIDADALGVTFGAGLKIANAATIGSASADSFAIDASGNLDFGTRQIGYDGSAGGLAFDVGHNAHFTASAAGVGVTIGTDDTYYGYLTIYGHGAGSESGGILDIYCSADYDDPIVGYRIRAYEDDLYIGPLSDTDALKLTAEKDLHITAGGLQSYAAVTPLVADGAALGSATLEWSDLYLADGGIIYFGDDQGVTLTHVADTGLAVNKNLSIGKATFETWSSGMSVLQIGGVGSIAGNTPEAADRGIYTTQNAYYDATDSRWETFLTDEAASIALYNGYIQTRVSNGAVTADSAITWIYPFTIQNDGSMDISTYRIGYDGSAGGLSFNTSNNATLSGNLKVDGYIQCGTNDSVRGLVYAYGPATGTDNGGTFLAYTGADHDANIQYWAFMPFEDDLYIGTNADTDVLKLTYEKDLHITAGGLVIADGDYIGSASAPQAFAIDASGNIDLAAHSIGYDGSAGGLSFDSSNNVSLTDNLFLPDDKQLRFGNTLAAPDAYIEYDTGENPDCLKIYASCVSEATTGVAMLFETRASDTIQFKPGGTATVLIGAGSVGVTGYITATGGSIFLMTNDTYLQGYTTGPALKEIIGINDSNKVEIDGNAIGTVFGGDIVVQRDTTIGTTDYAAILTFDYTDTRLYIDNNSLHVRQGYFYVGDATGADDTTPGFMTLFGNATGSAVGGRLNVCLAADHDTTIDSYEIKAYEDDLYIGWAGDEDVLKLTAEKDLHITAGGLVIADGDYIGSASTPQAFAIDASGNIDLAAHSIGYDGSAGGLSFNSSHHGTFSHDLYITGGDLYVGANDTTYGKLYLYSRATGYEQGGEIQLYNAVDYDTTLDFWYIRVWEDDLQIGPSNGINNGYVFSTVDATHFDFKVKTGNIHIGGIKSGATQVAAGAAAGELWKTASHATLPDNVVMIGG